MSNQILHCTKTGLKKRWLLNFSLTLSCLLNLFGKVSELYADIATLLFLSSLIAPPPPCSCFCVASSLFSKSLFSTSITLSCRLNSSFSFLHLFNCESRLLMTSFFCRTFSSATEFVVGDVRFCLD